MRYLSNITLNLKTPYIFQRQNSIYKPICIKVFCLKEPDFLVHPDGSPGLNKLPLFTLCLGLQNWRAGNLPETGWVMLQRPMQKTTAAQLTLFFSFSPDLPILTQSTQPQELNCFLQ